MAFMDMDIPIWVTGAYMWQPKWEARCCKSCTLTATTRYWKWGTWMLSLAAPLSMLVGHVAAELSGRQKKTFGCPLSRQYHAGNWCTRRRRRRGQLRRHRADRFDAGVAGNVSDSDVGGRLFAIVGDAPVMEAATRVAATPTKPSISWKPASNRCKTRCNRTFCILNYLGL